MSRITNNCVEQALSVIISVVSVKCEQWHKSGERTIMNLTETKHIFVFTWFANNELIYNVFKS